MFLGNTWEALSVLGKGDPQTEREKMISQVFQMQKICCKHGPGPLMSTSQNPVAVSQLKQATFPVGL